MHNEFENDSGVKLMLAYQAGDEASFDRLVESYSAQVFALLTRFLGQKSNREDLVQEVFLRVIRSRDRYQPTARFSTWLYRIVFNMAVNDTQRSAGREFQVFESQAPYTSGAAAGEHAGDGMSEMSDARALEPSEQLERNDVVQAVRRSIARLPENQRMALILAKYEELPYIEIAKVLGTSEKAIKSLVHRARESLRESLAPFLQGELS